MTHGVINYVYQRYGVPRTVRCDRGPNVLSRLIRAVNEALGTNMVLGEAYHHESQGLVERFNLTLIEIRGLAATRSVRIRCRTAAATTQQRS